MFIYTNKYLHIGALDESTIAHIAAAETLLKELQPKARDPMRFKVNTYMYMNI
jgi:hypothetical protein